MGPTARCALGLALGLVAGVARADVPEPGAKTSSLAWLRMPGSESCVAAQELARAVEVRLGREVFVPTSRADLSIEARVEPLPGRRGHKAVILVRGPGGETLGERTLEEKDPTCARLTEPLALVLALLIDPEGASSSRAAAPAPPPEAPPPAPPPPAPPVLAIAPLPPVPPPPDRTRAFRFEGTLLTTIATGLAPGAALGFGAASVLQLPRLPVSLRGEGALFVPVDARRSEVDAAFDLGLLGGFVCPTAYLHPRVRLLGCVGSQLGLGRARARAPFVSDDALRFLWNVGAQGRAAIQLAGPLVLATGVGLALPLVRTPLRLDRAPGEGVVVHELGPVTLTGDVGLGLVVP